MISRPSPNDERIFRAHVFWFLREYSEPSPICPLELVTELENTDLIELAPVTLDRVITVLERLELINLVDHDLPDECHMECQLPHFHPTRELRGWATDEFLKSLGWRESVLEAV